MIQPSVLIEAIYIYTATCVCFDDAALLFNMIYIAATFYIHS